MLRLGLLWSTRVASLLAWWLVLALTPVWAGPKVACTFENADLQTVLKKVGAFTDATFLFDPAQVQGKITILCPRTVSAAEALQLLASALALQGYTLRKTEAGFWVAPQRPAVPAATVIEVVPLQYANAQEVAATLRGITPPDVRIAPYSPTNSLLIAGDPRAVAQVVAALRGAKEDTPAHEPGVSSP
jgi:general secretion pathway protein D